MYMFLQTENLERTTFANSNTVANTWLQRNNFGTQKIFQLADASEIVDVEPKGNKIKEIKHAVQAYDSKTKRVKNADKKIHEPEYVSSM